MSEEISPDNFLIVTQPNGNCIIDQNSILLQRITDETYLYADMELVMKSFNIQIEKPVTVCTKEKEDQDKQLRSTWTREEILNLINLYKEYENKFKSTTVKNDKVWQDISLKISSHTWEQCKNKFKYLKSKYIENKDNMGAKASGAKAIKFEFFDEMDDIFKLQPNVNPVAIASSSRGLKNITNILDQGPNDNKRKAEEDSEKPVKKNKTSNSSYKKSNSSFREIQEIRENGRNRRHEENLEVMKELVSVFKDLTEAIKKH
ncbi:unnamed protein product [Brassicogethes aeneus]|uniref:Myb-like domain-containing protein n=1 Tax=Brassicogethes aeneus TaxID=1431903 RepID=A0A9P0FPX2_BRAAE|nr:unnamed protein product [Brassicogethes aeneus]